MPQVAGRLGRAPLLTEAAPAKINLSLHVTGRRPDGYHLLDSLVVFAGAHDRLSASPSDVLTLAIEGPFAPGLSTKADNLVLRAARALAEASGVRQGAAIRLEKLLPVASGIGGGSSDAAATLRLLSRLWAVAPPHEAVMRIAAGLGADVPVCLAQAPCRMLGIGDVLRPAPQIPKCGMVLVNPGAALATAAVFRARSGPFSTSPTLPASAACWPDAPVMARALAAMSNDLEAPAMALCPAIGDVLAALRTASGCLLARMSGSGATCLALFATSQAATQAAAALARPGWWCWGGGLWPAPDHLYGPVDPS